MADDVLFEIDIPIERDYFVNESPGIWKAFITPGSTVYIDDVGTSYFYGNRSDDLTRIESVRVDGKLYSQLSTLGDLQTQSESFYWDNANQVLYVRFENSYPPSLFENIFIGSVRGFSSKYNEEVNNIYDNIVYEERLDSVFNLTKNVDPLFFGILEYGGGSVSLRNADGELDAIISDNIFGQPCRLIEVIDNSTIQRYEGIVGEVNNDLDIISIAVRDKRIGLSRAIPINKYTDAADSKNNGKTIPICYGSVNNLPTVRLTATDTFRAVDDINSPTIVNVFRNGTGVSFVDNGDGSFVLTGVTNEEITADVSVSIENGLDIIEDILDRYLNISFNSSNYNTTEWNTSKASVYDSGIYITGEKIRDVIQQISQDNAGIFDVEDDGRFTFRFYDTSKAAVKDVSIDEFLSVQNINYPVDEFLTSVIMKFSKDHANNFFLELENKNFEDEVFAKFFEYNSRDYETTLNSTDASLLSNRIMERANDIFATVDIETSKQNNDIKILDIINLENDRITKEIQGVTRYEIIGINRDLTEETINLTCREVK